MIKEHLYDVIRGPAITEKGTQVSEHNQYLFNVVSSATKRDIKAAIEGLFGVKVTAVNTLVRKGKVKRFKGRSSRQGDTKKAYVTLAEGERLDITTGL